MSALLGLAEAAVNLSLSIALARRFGAVGVASGTLIALLVVSLPWTVLAASHHVGLSPSAWLKAGLAPHVVPILAAGGLLVWLRGIVPSTVPAVIAAAVAGVAVYVRLYMRFGSTEAERRRAWNMVKACGGGARVAWGMLCRGLAGFVRAWG